MRAVLVGLDLLDIVGGVVPILGLDIEDSCIGRQRSHRGIQCRCVYVVLTCGGETGQGSGGSESHDIFLNTFH